VFGNLGINPLEEGAEALWKKGLEAYVIRHAAFQVATFAISGS
jgi:hypothetical protein